MKKMRKTIGVLLAVVMVICMSVAALAATVTIPEELTGHTFKAYQIFTGTQIEGTKELADVKWGKGIKDSDFLRALKELPVEEEKPFADCETAADVAAVLARYADYTAVPQAVAKLANTYKTEEYTGIDSEATTLTAGYYLIVDDTKVENGDALNKTLLYVTGNNVSINVKTDKPTVEKKVLENNKYNQDGGYGVGYNDVADYNIGDDVSFKLIGTIPNMTHYDTYKYIFHDTLSSGLTYNSDSLKVYIVGSKNAELTTPLTKDENTYTVTATSTPTGSDLKIEFPNLKNVAGAKKGNFVIVTYTAKLNDNAVIGLDGNENKVKLEYSNNPNESTETGHTPEDKVVVFTYELDVTKVDGADNKIKLKDAEFKLKNSEGKWLTVKDNKVNGWVNSEDEATTLVSDVNGLIKISGLDDGTYYLKEMKAPTGYNTPSEPFTIVIKATTINNQEWNGTASSALTALTIKVDNETEVNGDTGTGIVSATIENNKGATLPSTGGMGTKIFYTLGGIAVLYAGVKLLTRRRMRNVR